jgi:hypothetical protein|tara:strand:+ start:3151 stop:4200 length:1050 start_codon:yes stop_codon:yes gene_type:complete
LRRVLAETIKSIREKGLIKTESKKKVISWLERDYLDSEVKAGVVILPTRGCSWGLAGGCTMCGYVYESSDISHKEIYNQFRDALEKLGDIDYLKIFNSGSFFDHRELDPIMIEKMFNLINQKDIQRVQVESRPEFLNKTSISKAKDSLLPELEVGIGLETSNDYIRSNCINKGSTLQDFTIAVNLCNLYDVFVKAYLLIKPPFLNEKESIEDALTSANDAINIGSSRVSFNPTSVHRYTFVEYLWNRHEYSPPWLWSLVEILLRCRNNTAVPILCHPTRAGKIRGPHNCGKCDNRIYNGLVNFSATQDSTYLEDLTKINCGCKEVWKSQLKMEQFSQGYFQDIRNQIRH